MGRLSEERLTEDQLKGFRTARESGVRVLAAAKEPDDILDLFLDRLAALKVENERLRELQRAAEVEHPDYQTNAGCEVCRILQALAEGSPHA